MGKTSVGCVGQGFVGGSLTTVLNEKGIDVYAFDKSGKYAEGAKWCLDIKLTKPGIQECDPFPKNVSELVTACETMPGFSKIFFVAVPTPMFDDGECDTSIVEGVLKELAETPGERIAVVKSTVPPGSTERWNKMFNLMGLTVIHSPEFLRERSAVEDTRNQDRIILGGPRPQINKVKQLFQKAFPNVPLIKTSSTNSELIKYITNCFLAMKISFANEIFQICEALDKNGLNIDYDRVIELATLDKRLGISHWQVPSMEVDENGNPLKGYGLVCFPKDVNALIYKAKSLNVKPTMLSATNEKNLEVRPQKDWAKLIGRATSKREK